MVPKIRVTGLNDQSVNPDGDYVLYWMTAFRRTNWNFAIDSAIEYCKELGKPLLVVEALRSDYRWNCDRFHDFLIRGMIDNQKEFQRYQVTYYPYVEPRPGAGSGLVEQLVKKSCVVVLDDYPCFFLPILNRMIARKSRVKVEMVDSNGLLPLRAADKIHSRAHFFRTFLQRNLKPHLLDLPEEHPFRSKRIPKTEIELGKIQRKWAPADFSDVSKLISRLPIDHSVPAINHCGGTAAAERDLQNFIEQKLSNYPDDRNYPQKNATSGLSPYLHFGHISSHQIFHDLMKHDHWNPGKIADVPTRKAEGWWGVSKPLEPFLDQLITWRELGFNMAWQDRKFDRYESLPSWARKTLAEHEGDPRETSYTLKEFESGETHDSLWNAAQNQLVTDGYIHNYLRMLWGKKILHWSESPEMALETMIELNNKYGLDGRDPNSYSGIFWILGRYDRAWGPERQIFGKIRYMTSENTARKYPVKEYIKRYGQR